MLGKAQIFLEGFYGSGLTLFALGKCFFTGISWVLTLGYKLRLIFVGANLVGICLASGTVLSFGLLLALLANVNRRAVENENALNFFNRELVMKNSIASIAFGVAIFAMVGSASAQLVLSGNTDNDSAIEFPQIEQGQIDLGLIEPGQIEPALAAPAAVQKPVTVLPQATVTAPRITPQTVPYVQPPAVVVQPPVQPTPAPAVIPNSTYVVPSTCAFLPKLQFNGRMTHLGLQVISADYGGVAERMGLEPGDIIASINGQSIRCDQSYKQALTQAAVYGGGNVTLKVRNVRWTPGCLHTQKYLTLAAQLPRRTVTAISASIAVR